ncbi:MAG: STAS domain-containing protein [Chitinispirillaceae bacterium]|jgi:anti-anti-sigma factor|nr:STAS domain-containing protein [Chitinispirillaceae bacterium]
MDTTGSESMEITVSNEAAVPTISLTGRIADFDVKRLQHKIEQLFRKQVPVIVIDVSKANFLDSHGLGALVYYHTQMQKENRKLVILNSNKDKSTYIRRLFELTNLDKVLTIVSGM